MIEVFVEKKVTLFERFFYNYLCHPSVLRNVFLKSDIKRGTALVRIGVSPFPSKTSKIRL